MFSKLLETRNNTIKTENQFFVAFLKKIIRKLKGRTEYLTKTYSQKLNKEEENRKWKKPEKQTNSTHL